VAHETPGHAVNFKTKHVLQTAGGREPVGLQVNLL
jgi:hypothetical protein